MTRFEVQGSKLKVLGLRSVPLGMASSGAATPKILTWNFERRTLNL
jgi:hypothetical protein